MTIAPFTYRGTPEIHFGRESASLLPVKIRKFGRNLLLVLGNRSFQDSEQWGALQENLIDHGIRYSVININSEPTPGMIDEAVSSRGNEDIDVVVSIGGGSVIDAGKAISAMLPKEGSVSNYLEGIGKMKHDGIKIPFIALPTTSGTGSEATNNAVICERGPAGYKKSLRHDHLVPDVAIVDPELTLGCPENITAASGMDAFTQLLESYTSRKASLITDSLAFEAIRCAVRSLFQAYSNGRDINARTDMAYAALVSGITLTNAGLGLIHGFASAIGGMYNIPHGAVCGSLFGIVNRVIILKLIETDKESMCLKKYASVGRLFSREDDRNTEFYALLLADKLEELVDRLRLPKLTEFDTGHFDMERIIASTGHKNNPVTFNRYELADILSKRL